MRYCIFSVNDFDGLICDNNITSVVKYILQNGQTTMQIYRVDIERATGMTNSSSFSSLITTFQTLSSDSVTLESVTLSSIPVTNTTTVVTSTTTVTPTRHTTQPTTASTSSTTQHNVNVNTTLQSSSISYNT